jgi:hypothetical protein
MAMTDQELLERVRFAVGSAKLTGSFAAPVGRGIWFTLDSGNAFCIEATASGWDLSDVTSCR